MLRVILEKYTAPLLFTLALHGVVLFAMLTQWAPETKKNEIKRPSYVQAKLVTLQDVSTPKKPAEQKPKIVDLTQKRKEEERRRKLEEQKKKKLALKRKQEAEQKRKKEAEQKKQAEAEKKRKAEAEKAKQEAAERAQREQAAFEQALAEEEMALQEQSYAVAAQSFMSAIIQRIEQNWSRPPSARNGMECELLIQLVPTGRVINVDVVRSSGNELFDRSAVQAVKKAEQFPEIKEMKPEVFERYYRELKLIFRPQDLRQ